MLSELSRALYPTVINNRFFQYATKTQVRRLSLLKALEFFITSWYQERFNREAAFDASN